MATENANDLAPLIAVKPPESTGYVWLQDGAARKIATVWAALSDVPAGARAQADAELIVTAVNSHHAVLAALKALVASYDGLRDSLTCPTVLDKLARADAAIAQAEGR